MQEENELIKNKKLDNDKDSYTMQQVIEGIFSVNSNEKLDAQESSDEQNQFQRKRRFTSFEELNKFLSEALKDNEFQPTKIIG